jgi:hypothetical protein
MVISTEIDPTQPVGLQNVVHKIDDAYPRIALKNDAHLNNEVAITVNHPIYNDYVLASSPENDELLEDEFNRIKTFNAYNKSNSIQNSYNENRGTEYVANDRYTVGKNTLGSKLFLRANDIETLQVNGVDTGSVRLLESGESNAILIPLVFQFRMTDALGRVDGNPELSRNSNIEYKQKIGIDLLKNNELFKFDVQVSAKFRSSSISNNNSDITSITNSIDTLSSIEPNIS